MKEKKLLNQHGVQERGVSMDLEINDEEWEGGEKRSLFNPAMCFFDNRRQLHIQFPKMDYGVFLYHHKSTNPQYPLPSSLCHYHTLLYSVLLGEPIDIKKKLCSSSQKRICVNCVGTT